MNDEDNLITDDLGIGQLVDKVTAEARNSEVKTSSSVSKRSKYVARIGTLTHADSVEHNLIAETKNILRSAVATYKSQLDDQQSWIEDTRPQYKAHAKEFLQAIQASTHLQCNEETVRDVANSLYKTAITTYGSVFPRGQRQGFKNHIGRIRNVYAHQAEEIFSKEQGF